jgi:hypothetical protein
MFTSTRFLAILVLGLGLGLVASAQPPTPERPVTPEVAAVLKLADNLEQKDVSLQAKRIVEEADPCEISRVFAKRDRGGAGIGSAARAGHQDGISYLVQDWSGPQPPTREELQTHRKDLLQVARVTQAMAEVAPFRQRYVAGITSGRPEKVAAEWPRVTAEFKTRAREFREAVETSEPGEVRKAAVNLQCTCEACHNLR